MLACQLMPLTPEARGFVELLDESQRGRHRMLARFAAAFGFYEALGFVRVAGAETVTHKLVL